MKRVPRSNNRKKAGILHPFSKDVIRGCLQFTGLWYFLAGFLHLTASYAPDYFRALLYRDAALQVAPVTLAAGIIAALIADLVLRKAENSKK